MNENVLLVKGFQNLGPVIIKLSTQLRYHSFTNGDRSQADKLFVDCDVWIWCVTKDSSFSVGVFYSVTNTKTPQKKT